MSLKKKFDRVFAIGFQLGVASTDSALNGSTFPSEEPEESPRVEAWQKDYASRLVSALKEFHEWQEKNHH